MKKFFTKWFLFGMLIFMIVPGCLRVKKGSGAPNIIFILTGDCPIQSISCYGNGLLHTPNIDRIYNEGIRFDSCFENRSFSLLSTMSEVLKNSDYKMYVVGKWDVYSLPSEIDYYSVLKGNGSYYHPDFIEDGNSISEKGYVTDIITKKAITYINKRDKSKPFLMFYCNKAPLDKCEPAQRHLEVLNNKSIPYRHDISDIYYESYEQILKHVDQFVDIVQMKEVCSSTSEPFSEMTTNIISENKSHSEDLQSWIQVSKTFHKKEYERMTDQEKRNWDRIQKQRIEDFYSEPRNTEEQRIWIYRQFIKNYLSTIVAIDENIGRLISYLEKINELDNTIIVYTSDFFLDYSFKEKHDSKDIKGTCIPMLVRYPKKIKESSNSSQIIMNSDIIPFIMKLIDSDIKNNDQKIEQFNLHS